MIERDSLGRKLSEISLKNRELLKHQSRKYVPAADFEAYRQVFRELKKVS